MYAYRNIFGRCVITDKIIWYIYSVFKVSNGQHPVQGNPCPEKAGRHRPSHPSSLFLSLTRLLFFYHMRATFVLEYDGIGDYNKTHRVIPVPFVPDGGDVIKVGNEIRASESGVDVDNTVFLINQAVTSPGSVFAFSAWFRSNKNLAFQIWTPVNGTNSYRLKWQLPVTPSVTQQQEDVSRFSWWRHQMETVSASLALCEGITGGFPPKASDAELWYFFYLRLNKRSSKQSIRRWFKTPLRPLWRQCNVNCFPCAVYKNRRNFFGPAVDHQWRKFGWSGQYRPLRRWGNVLCTFDNIRFCWCYIYLDTLHSGK